MEKIKLYIGKEEDGKKEEEEEKEGEVWNIKCYEK